MTSSDLKSLLALTLRDPGQAARLLMGLHLPLPVRWMVVLLAVSLSGVLTWLGNQIAPVPPQMRTPLTEIMTQPLVMALIQLAAVVVAAGLMAGVGRIFGGHGRFEDALLLTVWIEIVLLLVQLAQILAAIILPGLVSILSILAFVLFFWLLIRFTKELHGFTSGFKVLMVLLPTMLIVGFFLSILAASFGLIPEIPQ